MTCYRCRLDPHPPNSDPRRCAFPNDEFVSDNWNCATMGLFRDIAGGTFDGPEFGVKLCGDDDYCFAASFETHADRGFLVLGWHKNRGRTSSAVWLNDDGAHPLTIQLAELLLRDWRLR